MRPRPNVLVTGANGFVGTALVNYLLESGKYYLRCATRTNALWPRNVAGFTIGDIDGETDWQSALNDLDVVVHLAARVHIMHDTSANPLQEFRRVNVQGTLALAEQAAKAGVLRFIFLSSVKVNGEEGVFTESDTPAPLDNYGVSKLEAEIGLREIAQRTGMDVVIIRPPLVYGPGVKANFHSLQRLVARGIPFPFASVKNKRSLVAIDNLTNFINVAIAHPSAANETFLVSDGNDLSTAQLVQAMARAEGREAKLFSVPEGLLEFAATVIGKRSVARRLLRTLQLDTSKARKLLGWQPPVTVEEGLRRSVAPRK
ncbi:MAG: SDR family oxidoreductase [Gemmatimonadaceae bacterium]